MIARSYGAADSAAEIASALEGLAMCIDRAVDQEGTPLRLGPLRAYRASAPTKPENGILAPVICVVAQGRKEVVLGNERFVYDPGHYLVNSTHVPAVGRTLEATKQCPCLWVSIQLDPSVVTSVIEEGRLGPASPQTCLRSVEASRMDLSLLRAVIRLVWVLDTPKDADFLVPLAMRELVYRLLKSDQAARVRQIVAHAGEDSRIARAIRRLREHYDQPFSIGELARECGMSPSVLHQRFREVTAMSPIQYQKQLRLQEAKRLIASGETNAAEAAFRVGYDSSSHFSRDYRKFFGDPPRRHAARVTDAAFGP